MLAHVSESTKFKPSAKPKLSWGRPPPSPQMSSLAARGYHYKRHFFFLDGSSVRLSKSDRRAASLLYLAFCLVGCSGWPGAWWFVRRALVCLVVFLVRPRSRVRPSETERTSIFSLVWVFSFDGSAAQLPLAYHMVAHMREGESCFALLRYMAARSVHIPPSSSKNIAHVRDSLPVGPVMVTNHDMHAKVSGLRPIDRVHPVVCIRSSPGHPYTQRGK